jgi:hypothetical protein
MQRACAVFTCQEAMCLCAPNAYCSKTSLLLRVGSVSGIPAFHLCLAGCFQLPRCVRMLAGMNTTVLFDVQICCNCSESKSLGSPKSIMPVPALGVSCSPAPRQSFQPHHIRAITATTFIGSSIFNAAKLRLIGSLPAREVCVARSERMCALLELQCARDKPKHTAAIMMYITQCEIVVKCTHARNVGRWQRESRTSSTAHRKFVK